MDTTRLRELGTSPALASHYVQTGWLTRLGRGFFMLPNDESVLAPPLAVLARHVPGLHVGGKTALAWCGIRHNVGSGEKGANPRFVVTNIVGDSQRLHDRRYCARGEMENRVKEQMMLFADRVSARRWWANQWRLCLSAIAYTLIETVRRLALRGTELAAATVATIRTKLIKIGASAGSVSSGCTSVPRTLSRRSSATRFGCFARDRSTTAWRGERGQCRCRYTKQNRCAEPFTRAQTEGKPPSASNPPAQLVFVQ